MGLSILMRVAAKVITDYTGVVQLRASGELGGAYWTLNMLLAIAMTFASVYIDFESDVDEAMSEETAWLAVSLLGGAWLTVFLTFLVLMKKKYRATFLSLQTGNDYFQNYFLKTNTDERRAGIVKKN